MQLNSPEISFGKIIRNLRVRLKSELDDSRPMSREELAQRANQAFSVPSHNEITPEVIDRIENGAEPNLIPFLEPLAEALQLSDTLRSELFSIMLYASAFDSPSTKRPYIKDQDKLVENELEESKWPACLLTTHQEILAVNSPFVRLFQLESQLQILKNHPLGAHLFALLFDDIFGMKDKVNHKGLTKERSNSVFVFDNAPLYFLLSANYQHIINTIATLPSLGELRVMFKQLRRGSPSPSQQQLVTMNYKITYPGIAEPLQVDSFHTSHPLSIDAFPHSWEVWHLLPAVNQLDLYEELMKDIEDSSQIYQF